MEIYFSKKMKKRIEEDSDCLLNYGKITGRVIIRRKNELRAANCLEDMRNMVGKHHELTGDKKRQLACSLTANYRLIYEPYGDSGLYIIDNSLIWSNVKSVIIIEIEDYH